MKRIVDIHNHVVFAVDDGARNIEESIDMIKQAAKYGITDVVATPHQYEKDQVSELHERQDVIIQNFEELRKAVKSEEIPVKLHLGSELYFTTYVINAPDVKYFTYNDKKKYLLIEFSMNWQPEGFKEVFYELIQNGLTPVLAHPERYSYFWDIADDIMDLIKMGTLLQINAGSLLGYHGLQARFISDMLLKEDLAHVIASDAHRARRSYGFNLMRTVEEYSEKYPDINIQKLISDNPLKIVEGKTLDIEDEPCYNFNKDKFYKQWRRFHFFQDILGMGGKKKKIKKRYT